MRGRTRAGEGRKGHRGCPPRPPAATMSDPTRPATPPRAQPAAFAGVAALAAAAGCGATKLLLTCRRHLHVTPQDALLEARLQHARTALQHGRARVLDVALDAGFQGSSAFHANFRARFL